MRLLDEPARAAFGLVGVFAAPVSLDVDRAGRRRHRRRRARSDGGAARRVARHLRARAVGRAALPDARDDPRVRGRRPRGERGGAGRTGQAPRRRRRRGAPLGRVTSRRPQRSRRPLDRRRGLPRRPRGTPAREGDESRRARVPDPLADLALLALARLRRGRPPPSRRRHRLGRRADPAPGRRERAARRVCDRAHPRRPPAGARSFRACRRLVRRGRRAGARGQGHDPARVHRERERRSRALARAQRASRARAPRRRGARHPRDRPDGSDRVGSPARRPRPCASGGRGGRRAPRRGRQRPRDRLRSRRPRRHRAASRRPGRGGAAPASVAPRRERAGRSREPGAEPVRRGRDTRRPTATTTARRRCSVRQRRPCG